METANKTNTKIYHRAITDKELQAAKDAGFKFIRTPHLGTTNLETMQAVR